MSSLKFECIEVTYNTILDRHETYNTIRKLAQKGAKNSVIPSAYVINIKNKTVALILYGRQVEWRNLNKLDISDTIKATIKKVNKDKINSTIISFKTLDPDIYPANLNLEFKLQTEDDESLTSNEETLWEIKSPKMTSDIYIQCKNCYSKVLSKNLYITYNRCIKCINKKTNKEIAAEKYLELDPSQIIKTSIELLDEYVIFDKSSNMTKKEHLNRITQLENRLDDITLALNTLLKENNKLMIVSQMQLYLINIGDAVQIVKNHFHCHPGQNPILEGKRILLYGLTDDIDGTIDKLSKIFNYIGKDKYKVKLISSRNTDSMVGDIKLKNLREKINEKISSYIFHDKCDYSNTFDDKLVICNDVEIEYIVDSIKTI